MLPSTASDPIVLILLALATLVVISLGWLGLRKYDSARKEWASPKVPPESRTILRAKQQLTEQLFKNDDFSNVHAVGVSGELTDDETFLQVFVDDASPYKTVHIPSEMVTEDNKRLRVEVIQMPRAKALCGGPVTLEILARRQHDPLIAGVSAANSAKDGWGTLGFFCKKDFVSKAASAFLDNNTYLLSNAHVFASDVTTTASVGQTISQSSPKDHDERVVGVLTEVKTISFNDRGRPNLVDAAIARKDFKWSHLAEVAHIGKLKGYRLYSEIRTKTKCHKFGRTTTYTKGTVYSKNVNILVSYGPAEDLAFFRDQIIIVPDEGEFGCEGDSGSPVLDMNNYAIGLLFAANDGTKVSMPEPPVPIQQIPMYGVANPIETVLKTFGLKLETS